MSTVRGFDPIPERTKFAGRHNLTAALCEARETPAGAWQNSRTRCRDTTGQLFLLGSARQATLKSDTAESWLKYPRRCTASG